MKSIIPKHIVLINGVEIDLSNPIEVEYDIDRTFYTGSTTLPQITSEQLSKDLSEEEKDRIMKTLLDIKELDSIKIYYKEYETKAEANNATKEEMNLIVNAFVKDLEVNESKENAIDRKLIFNSTMGFCYENSMQYDLISTSCRQTFFDGLRQNGLIPTQNINYSTAEEVISTSYSKYLTNTVNDTSNNYIYTFTGSIIETIKFDEFTHNDYFIVKCNCTTNFGEGIDTVKQNHAVKIYQSPDGTVNVLSPAYFSLQSAEVLVFDLNENVNDIAFGGLTNLYNAVYVVGTGCTGFAFDPFSYESQLPEDADEDDKPFDSAGNYKTNFSPNMQYLRVKYLFRRNIFDGFNAFNTAINELYNISKSSVVSFETVYTSDLQPGRLCNIKNSNYLKYIKGVSDDQLWIIKNVKITISKENISATVQVYRNMIADFPEKFIISPDSLSLLDASLITTLTKTENSTLLH